jgi:ectoine hydroxylase-related dioxygenase (phytanoyl-CoA dioxygenase family)
MAHYRKQVEEMIDLTVERSNTLQNRHLDCRPAFELCSHPALLDRMESLIGKNLVLWRSYFFVKYPGSKAVPWHQDINYWPIEPPLNVSAWVAMDEAIIENSCVQLIPGSHRDMVPHLKSEGTVFREEADPAYYDSSKAIPMELKPGQFFLFSERILHYSAPNSSNKRRLGLAVRMTVPFVKVYQKNDPHNNVLLVRGDDEMKLNTVGVPPL